MPFSGLALSRCLLNVCESAWKLIAAVLTCFYGAPWDCQLLRTHGRSHLLSLQPFEGDPPGTAFMNEDWVQLVTAVDHPLEWVEDYVLPDS